jgi:archaellum component FlaF (FlaF/FlaG flagellin family)
MLKGSDNKRYLLSNNHVLARSDHANVGDRIIQPGLIDNNCTPSRRGSGPAQVATLSGWPALKASSTNVDAAIAQVESDAVDQSGSILEMGAKQSDGTLAAAPPGISSSGGKGEAATLQLKVAKSGRTTGQTCASISAVDFDVNVDYFQDCAETVPYLSKTFTNQIAISGDGFSDAGDSGSLVLDSGNAEPVGLYFAGGIDTSGVSQAIASPAPEVLNELNAQVGNGVTYTYVGTSDHAVSCLNYGDSTVSAAQFRTLADAEIVRAQQALEPARTLVRPAAGVLGVATGKSSDHPGEAAVLVYVDENMSANVPTMVAGVRTHVIPTNGRAVAAGAAPLANFAGTLPGLQAAAFNAAAVIKQQYAAELMKQNPSFFGVGVGQSLDNPREAALVVFVDRRSTPAQLPENVGGLRTRFIVMDRLHVTRAYASAFTAGKHCMAHPAAGR